MTSVAFQIHDASEAAAARRTAEAVAVRIGFDSTRVGQLAIVVMELATNIAKHAHHGELLVTECRGAAGHGVEVLALDKGRGLADFDHSVRDGQSTAGSLGHGLGAVRRLANDFQIYAQSSQGTAAMARLWPQPSTKPDASRFAFAGVNVAKRGERVSGDAWLGEVGRHSAALIVADGLGHGLLANEAAMAAMAAFARDPFRSPARNLDDVHMALRPTRGAAVAIAALDFETGVLRYAGLGNISGSIVDGTTRRSLVSHNGTAGHTARHMQEFTYPLPASATFVMHSDGLASGWNPKDYIGLWTRDPALVAGVLYRDFTRGRDDVTVVVGRRLG